MANLNMRDRHFRFEATQLHKEFTRLWKNGNELSDFTIEVDNKEFKVHKVILASVSEFLKDKIMGHDGEAPVDRLKIDNCSKLAVSNIIEFIYTNHLKGELASSRELFLCAHFLKVPTAVKAATTRLIKEINFKNCFDTYGLFHQCISLDQAEKVAEYVRKNFDKIIKVSEVNDMSFGILKSFTDLWQDSEWDLFLILEGWVNADYENRKNDIRRVMGWVRFGLFTTEQLEAIKERQIYKDCEGKSWCPKIDEALKYQQCPDHEKVTFYNRSFQDTQRVEKIRIVFSKGKTHALRQEEKWKVGKLSAFEIKMLWQPYMWQELDVSEVPEFLEGPAAVLNFNGFLIVCALNTGKEEWHIFNPRDMKWSSMANPSVQRKDFALVQYNEDLLLLGGRIVGHGSVEHVTDVVEKYDFSSGTWTVADIKMPVALHKHYGCEGELNIYIAGGWGTIETSDTWSTNLYYYGPQDEDDPCSKDNWIKKSPMPLAEPCILMQYMDIGKLEDFVVLFNSSIGKGIQCYDPRKDQWQVLEIEAPWPGTYRAKWHAASSATTVYGGKSAYFFNLKLRGFDSFDRHPEAENLVNGLGTCYRINFREDKPPKRKTVRYFPHIVRKKTKSVTQKFYVCDLLQIPRNIQEKKPEPIVLPELWDVDFDIKIPFESPRQICECSLSSNDGDASLNDHSSKNDSSNGTKCEGYLNAQSTDCQTKSKDIVSDEVPGNPSTAQKDDNPSSLVEADTDSYHISNKVDSEDACGGGDIPTDNTRVGSE